MVSFTYVYVCVYFPPLFPYCLFKGMYVCPCLQFIFCIGIYSTLYWFICMSVHFCWKYSLWKESLQKQEFFHFFLIFPTSSSLPVSSWTTSTNLCTFRCEFVNILKHLLKSPKLIFDQFVRHFRQFWATLIFFIFYKKFCTPPNFFLGGG